MSLIFGGLGQALGWPAGGPQQNNFGTMVFYTNPGAMTLAEWQALGGANAWSPPEPVEHAGIELGEVIAWRCWQLCRDTGLLTSMSASNIWMPGEPLKADVDDSGHGTMGVHAYKLAADAMSDYGRGGRMARPCVVGRVMLWGEIVEHENGYRAEFGLPLSLEHIVPSRWRTRRWLRRLKALYEPASPPPRATQRCTGTETQTDEGMNEQA